MVYFYFFLTFCLFIFWQYIDVLFYYFRKEGIFHPTSCVMRFTVTDDLFDQRIQSLFSSFVKKKHDANSLILENHLIVDYIRGYRMKWNLDWCSVDDVFSQFIFHRSCSLQALVIWF